MQVYVNGQFVSAANASVSVFDHGFLYGDGVFEGIRVYDGTIFRLPHADDPHDARGNGRCHC